MEAAVFHDLRAARAAFRLGRLKYRCAACGSTHWSGSGTRCAVLLFEAAGFFFTVSYRNTSRELLYGTWPPVWFIEGDLPAYQFLRDSFRKSRAWQVFMRLAGRRPKHEPFKAAAFRDPAGEGFEAGRHYSAGELEPWLALEPAACVGALIRFRALYWTPVEVRAKVAALRAAAREFFGSIRAERPGLPAAADSFFADRMLRRWSRLLPERTGRKRALGAWIGRAAAVVVSPLGYLVWWYAGPAAWFWRHVLTPEDMEVLTGGPAGREFWEREMARPVGRLGFV